MPPGPPPAVKSRKPLLRQINTGATHLFGHIFEFRLTVSNVQHGLLIMDMNAGIEFQFGQQC